MRLWALLACLVLTACSIGAPDTGPQAQCERQADDDPAVKAFYTGTNGAYMNEGRIHDEFIAAKRQAVLRCMRAKGLAPPGGVQPVKIQY